MFCKLNITLENKSGYDINISSILHGALMQFMTTEYVESLHSNGLRPYTQHVENK